VGILSGSGHLIFLPPWSIEWRLINVNHDTDDCIASCGDWFGTCMAVQQRVGILSEWWTGVGSYCPGRFASHGQDLEELGYFPASQQTVVRIASALCGLWVAYLARKSGLDSLLSSPRVKRKAFRTF
jgi:hypothetical protein